MVSLYALRTTCVAVVMFCLFPEGGRAQPVVTQCAPGTLTQYSDLGETGCRLNDKVFGGFDFTSIFGTESPSGNDILVTPIATPFNPGFTFVASPAFTVTQGTGAEGWVVTYFVRVDPTGNPVTDLSLEIDGTNVANDGAVDVNEGACLGQILPPFGVCPANQEANAKTTFSEQETETMDDDAFPVTMLLDVNTAIGLDPGVDGSASLTTLVEQFSEISVDRGEVPEPQSGVLFLGSLIVWRCCVDRRRGRSVPSPA